MFIAIYRPKKFPDEVHTSDNEEEYEEEVKYQHIKIVYSYIVYTVY
jgi:hypothetical protein